MQGNVALMIDSYSSMKGNLAEGKIRALAIVRAGTLGKHAGYSHLAGSAALPNYDVVSWNALFAPAGTPPEIIRTLNQALREILAEPEVKKRLLELGIEARPATPEEISAQAEIRYRQVAKGDREGRDSEAIAAMGPGREALT